MSGFAWTEAMSVGVPALDADHRCLVRIINLLEDADGDDDGRVIEIVINTSLLQNSRTEGFSGPGIGQ